MEGIRRSDRSTKQPDRLVLQVDQPTTKHKKVAGGSTPSSRTKIGVKKGKKVRKQPNNPDLMARVAKMVDNLTLRVELEASDDEDYDFTDMECDAESCTSHPDHELGYVKIVTNNPNPCLPAADKSKSSAVAADDNSKMVEDDEEQAGGEYGDIQMIDAPADPAVNTTAAAEHRTTPKPGQYMQTHRRGTHYKGLATPGVQRANGFNMRRDDDEDDSSDDEPKKPKGPKLPSDKSTPPPSSDDDDDDSDGPKKIGRPKIPSSRSSSASPQLSSITFDVDTMDAGGAPLPASLQPEYNDWSEDELAEHPDPEVMAKLKEAEDAKVKAADAANAANPRSMLDKTYYEKRDQAAAELDAQAQPPMVASVRYHMIAENAQSADGGVSLRPRYGEGFRPSGDLIPDVQDWASNVSPGTPEGDVRAAAVENTDDEQMSYEGNDEDEGEDGGVQVAESENDKEDEEMADAYDESEEDEGREDTTRELLIAAGIVDGRSPEEMEAAMNLLFLHRI